MDSKQVRLLDDLSDEQCDKFRAAPGSFNTMVRSIYAAGANAVQAKIDGLCESLVEVQELLGPEDCNNCDLASDKLGEIISDLHAGVPQGSVAIDREALSQFWNMLHALRVGDLGSAQAAGEKAEKILMNG